MDTQLNVVTSRKRALPRVRHPALLAAQALGDGPGDEAANHPESEPGPANPALEVATRGGRDPQMCRGRIEPMRTCLQP